MNTYYLSEEQFKKLWKVSLIKNNTLHDRQEEWQTSFAHKYNLEYFETGHPASQAFYGALHGEQKYITLFLLQL